MNTYSLLVTRTNCPHQSVTKIVFCLFVVMMILHTSKTPADTGRWQSNGTFQTYWQSYRDADTRENAFNLGVYITNKYLETASVGFSYNFTSLDLAGGAELAENVFQIGGQYHIFLDEPAGKLSLRMDAYVGENTLEYNTSSGTVGNGMGGRRRTGASLTSEDSVDINVYNPMVSYINQTKNLYVDLGYAYSKYSGTSTTKVNQLTPTIGFGWNENIDWLQLRGYLIGVDDAVNSVDKNFNALELKYTHWLGETARAELIRFTALVGDRQLAVDPDSGTVYSIDDTQAGSLSAGVQWKLANSSRFLTVVKYNRFENEVTNISYDTLILYFNLQLQW